MEVLNFESILLPDLVEDLDDIEFLDVSGEEHVFQFQLKKLKNSYLTFSTRKLQYCCGILEVGCLGINLITQENFNNFMKEFFSNINIQVMICTSEEDTRTWHNYLQNCPTFRYVEEFRNNNSGNYVKVWMKTNVEI